MARFDLDKGFACIIGTKSCILAIIEKFFLEKSNELLNKISDDKYVSLDFENVENFNRIPFKEIGEKFPECEIFVVYNQNRYGENPSLYKPVGDSVGRVEYLFSETGYNALFAPHSKKWLNLLVSGDISYSVLEILLKSGKSLKCIIDDVLLSDEIARLKISNLDLNYLVQICSKSVAEKSRTKYIREFLKTTKSTSNIEQLVIDSFCYRKELTTNETEILSDKSIVKFVQTHAVESMKHTFDFDAKIFTAKHSVQVVAMKDPENKKYNLETYNTFSETTQTEII